GSAAAGPASPTDDLLWPGAGVDEALGADGIPTDAASRGADPLGADPLGADPFGGAAGSQDLEFRVICPVCDSVDYARVSQVGQMLRCEDCHTEHQIPQPTPEQLQAARPKTQQRINPHPMTDLHPGAGGAAGLPPGVPGAAPAPGVAGAGPSGVPNNLQPSAAGFDPRVHGNMTRSAESYMQEAEEHVANREPEDNEYSDPDVKLWLTNLTKILFAPSTIIHIILLTVGLSVPLLVAVVGKLVILLVGSVIGQILILAIVLSYCFAILEAAANGANKITWPHENFMERFSEAFIVMAAFFLAVGPLAGLALAITRNWPLPLVMGFLGMFFVFPFVLLSMLAEQSFIPFSTPVIKSIKRNAMAWTR
ncbi:MAG: hypothetical protein AAFN70_19635, partial [Planctomycetota bacterium]